MGPEVAVGAGAAGAGAAGLTAAELAALEAAALTSSGTALGAGVGSAFAPAALGTGTALQLGSIGVRGAAEYDAAQRRKSLSKAMQTYGTDRARRGTEITEGFIAGDAPAAREVQRASAEKDAANEFQTSVGAAQAFEAKDATAGKTSDDYTRSKVAAADRQSQRNARLIEQLSRMRSAPRAGEARGRRYSVAAGDLAGEMGALDRVSRGYMTDIGNVQTNPYAKVASDAMSGYGLGLDEIARRNKVRAALRT